MFLTPPISATAFATSALVHQAPDARHDHGARVAGMGGSHALTPKGG